MSDDAPVLSKHSGRIFRLIEKGERVSSLGELPSVPKLKEHDTLEKRPWTRLRIVVVGDDRDFVGIISRVLASTDPCTVIPFVYQRFEWTCDMVEHNLNVTQLETTNEEWLLRLVVCESAVVVCVFNGTSLNADNSVGRFSSLISLNCPRGIAAIGLVVGRPLIQHKRFTSWMVTPSLPEGTLEKQKLRDQLRACVVEVVRKKRYLPEAPVGFALLHQAFQGHSFVARGVVDNVSVGLRISSKEVLEFLHKTGDVVFFSSDRYLSSIVVMSLNWIAEHVSAMIRFSSSINGFLGVDEMSLLCGSGENVLGPFVVEILLRAMVCLGVVWSKVVPTSSSPLVKVLVPITLLPTTETHIGTGLCHSRCFMLDRFSASNFAGFEATCAFHCISDQSSWNLHSFSMGREGCSVFVNFWALQTGEAMVVVSASASTSNKERGIFFDVLTMLEDYLNSKNLAPSRSKCWVFCPSCLGGKGLIISKACWSLVGAFALSKFTSGDTLCTRCKACLSWKDLVPELLLVDLPQLSCTMTDVILGQGGNASVVLASGNSGKVAVKKLHLFGRASSDDLATSLITQRKEICLMWSVRGCDRIAGVLGVNSSVFPPLIVMEFCKEGELTRYLYDENGVSRNLLSQKLKIQIALDVLVALSFLHRQEPCMIHRDVRSPNVLLCHRSDALGEPAAKLCDFGLATWCVQGVSYPLPTFQWLSPEVLLGTMYDQSADIYSFGMLLYEIVAERIPFSEFDHLMTVRYENKTQLWKEVVARDSICSGLRPTVSNVPFGQLMRDCWLEPLQRPSATVLLQLLSTMTENAVPNLPKIVCSRGTLLSESVSSTPCGHRAFLSDPELLRGGDPAGKVVNSCCLDERGCLWMSLTDGRMIVVDVKSGEQRCFKGEKTCFSLTSISSRGMIVGAMWSGELFCWEHHKRKMKVFQGAWLDVPRGKCKQIASGPNGVHVWTGDEEGNVLCWKWEQSSIRRKGKYSLVGKLCFGRDVNSVALLHDSRNCTMLLVGIGSPLDSQVFAIHSSMFETPPHRWSVGVDLLPGKNPGLIFVRDMHLWSLNGASGVAVRFMLGFDESKNQLSVEQLYSIRLNDPLHLAFSPFCVSKVLVLERDGQLLLVKNCGRGTHIASRSDDVKLKMAFHHKADSFVCVGESGHVIIFSCK